MEKAKKMSKFKRRRIQFEYKDAGAQTAYLVGDFNEWNPQSDAMKKDIDGTWKKVKLLIPGRYEYKFLVDGIWKEDPENGHRCLNSFGTFNCIVNII